MKELIQALINQGIITATDIQRMTTLELLLSIVERVNELHGLTKEGLEATQEGLEAVQRLLDNGVQEEVVAQFNKWLQDGTFDALLNQSALKKVNERIDETNAQLSHKASEKDLEIERKRIDSFTKLSEGSTTGDAELIDGRIGADGKVYENIGSAIRGQTGELKETLDDLKSVTSVISLKVLGSTKLDMEDLILEDVQGVYDTVGRFTPNEVFDVRRYNSKSNYNVKVTISEGSFCFNVIRNGAVSEGFQYVSSIDYNVTDKMDGFVICYNRTTGIVPSIVKNTDVSIDNQLSELYDIINPQNIISPSTFKWDFGHLSVDGSYYNNDNKSICTKDTHLLNRGTILSVNEGFKMQIALFTIDDVLVDRILWRDEYTLDNDYKCRIEVATLNEDVLPDFSIASNLLITGRHNIIAEHSKAISEIRQPLDKDNYELNNLINNIGFDFFKNRPLEIVNRDKFNVWSMIAKYKEGLICFYSEADKHDASVANPYYTISTNGVSWSKPKNIFPIQNARMDVTGAGNDNDGNPLVWVRYKVGNFKLYKYDGTDFTLLSTPNLSMTAGHISNIFKGEDCLMCFWDSFNPVGMWGVLKSTDNGVTWDETVVETGLTSTTKPTEISGVYLGNNKIIAIGRRDNASKAMDQLQSTDNGVTWTRMPTNINEAGIDGNTPALIYNSDTNKLILYYYHRGEVTVKSREALLTNIWDAPMSWGEAVNIHTFNHPWIDGGNLQAIKYRGCDYLVMYDATIRDVNSGIYSIIH